MGYLVEKDYDGHILPAYWAQVQMGKLSLQAQAEAYAIAEITSQLCQKYDTKQEFTDTLVYSLSATYRGDQLIYLDGKAFDVAVSYVAANITLFTDNKVYVRNSYTTGYTAQLPTDSAYWTLLGNRFDLYYTTPPFPAYNWQLAYSAGDKVFYQGFVYTAVQNVYANSPIIPGTNLNYWSAPVSYSVTGELPSNTAKWTFGDNRSILVYNWAVEIAVFFALNTISSRNVPQSRIDSYRGVIQAVKDAGTGLRTIQDLPLLQPTQGRTIKFNSGPKNFF